MQVRILLFAGYRELAGTAELRLELGAPATVEDAVSALRGRGGALARLPPRPAAAVNQVYAPPGQPLRDGDELALLPPVAGG
jgi:molybdopterin converting factor small subunit